MTDVALLLQPGAARNRSMALYARRLAENAPPGEAWRVAPLRALPLDRDGRLSELLVPPLKLRGLEGDVAHVADHAHAGYGRWLRQPTVVTVHDLIPWKALAGEYPAAAGATVSRRAAAWLRWNFAALDRAVRLVAPSRATAEDLQRLFGRTAEVVPHGVDEVFAAAPAAETTARVRGRLKRHAGRPLLLQVSSGFFYKNDGAVLQAFAALAERQPELVWVRVGAPLAPTLRAQVALSPWRQRFLEFGDATAAELAALYRQATVLLFPSWDEGFGWPPLEAMAAGCAVVASAAGALAEVAGAAALIGPPDDARTLALLVGRVLRDEGLRQDMVNRGRAHATGFLWRRATAHMAEIYAEAARCA